MILEFPYIAQSTDFSCGAASLQGIMLYYGISITEENLINELKSTPVRGTKVEDMIRVAKKYGLKAESCKGTIDMIIDSLVQNVPVIINLQAWSNKKDVDYTNNYNNGHYVVAIGFEEDIIIFADPSCTFRTFLTHEELVRRWHDKENESSYTKNLMIVIEGKTPKYKQSTIKHMD